MNLDILKDCSLFRDMGEELIDKALICLGAFYRTVPKHGYLLDVGDVIREVGVIISGSAIIVTETANGGRTIIDKLLPGDVYGEAIVCSGISRSTNRILAVEECEVVKIGMENIIHANLTKCTIRSQIVENLLRLSANRCVSLNRKMDILSHKSVRERVLYYLSDEMERCNRCDFIIRFSRNELAEYLQLDRSALSRELGRIRDDGIIDYDKARFRILEPAALQQLKIM